MNKKLSFKRGATSIYAVIFLTLMFGIITMSFVRIVINESISTTNADLYKSAYDSAMAGVEDAKIAVLKYHDCISQGYTANKDSAETSCPRIIYEMEQGIADESCDVVARVLGRENGGEDTQYSTIIQETQSTSDEGSSSYMEQAYTCVKITEETDDYLTTLTAADSTRIIPLHSADLTDINAIEFSWFSDVNASSTASNYMIGSDATKTELKDNSQTYAPPVVTFEIFQTDSANGAPYFNVGELSVNNSKSTGTDHAMLVFEPKDGTGKNIVDAATVLDHSDKYSNDLIITNCKAGERYACTTTIMFPPTYRNTPRAAATTFLKVSLPYQRPSTDISVSLCKTWDSLENKCSSYTKLTGVQAAIDSTGRANDLYRRVEARVELVDLYYPYPEYAIFLGGSNETNKSYWVTNNCKRAENGSVSSCSNSGSVW
ncbi:hypothetical protein IJI69_04735 [Candidatus Saccharibacteria bacterium]|nr:hypothetical protein [Candidatus Saccharibacteria bacterium]